jgi:dipeptidyl aminopeptidase/acylaminoacyl peptidase
MFPRPLKMLLAAIALAAVYTLMPLALAAPAAAQEEAAGIADVLEELQSTNRALRHRLDQLMKAVDDGLWFDRVGDVAVVEKVRIYGPPKWKEDSSTAIGAGNPVKFYAYLFTPRDRFGDKKLPLLVFPHGGVHGDFDTYYAHIVRELMAQGYVVVAPEYRGSTGYGQGIYEAIDYGGREVEDCLAARDWVVDHHPRVDAERVGLIGWSHGGLITLMSLFNHPESYVVGFAGVPVSDLVQRLGYLTDGYRALYSADYFIGQTVNENLEEYKRRSPVWNVDKLERPVRVHGNVSDEDVNVIEVEHLVQALTAAGKEFEHQIYDLPGGHSFDRLDTPEAWEVRQVIYRFLARYLKPPRPDVELGLNAEGRAAP